MKNETPCNVVFTQFYHYSAGVSLSLVRVPFLCRNILMWRCIVFSFNSLNIMRYVSKTCLSCRIILMHHVHTKLLEPSRMFWKFQGLFLFLLFATPWNFETAVYEPTKNEVWLYSAICLCHARSVTIYVFPLYFFFFMLSHFPVMRLQYHPLSDVCDCLFNVFTHTSVAGGHLLHQECENCPSHRRNKPTLIAPVHTFIDDHWHPRKWYYG